MTDPLPYGAPSKGDPEPDEPFDFQAAKDWLAEEIGGEPRWGWPTPFLVIASLIDEVERLLAVDDENALLWNLIGNISDALFGKPQGDEEITIP